jgi:restriction system protein
MTKAAYCVRADRGNYAGAFKNGGYAAVGWEVGDLSRVPRGDEEALGASYDAAYPEAGRAHRGQSVGQIRKFLWEIGPGDVVVTPTAQAGHLLVGVAGDRYYHGATPDCPYAHRREISWQDEPVLRSSLSVPLQHTLRARLAVFEVKPPDELLRAAGEEAPTPRSVERAERNASDAVRERMLELDPDEFEVLVAELLTVLGFEAEKIGRTGDGGVDVEGTLDVYGLARADLKVQVKRYKGGNPVDHKAIRDFRGSVPERAQGAFVTTSGYTKKAREVAEKAGFKRIGLIDGDQLVDILAQEYGRLPEEVRERLGLRRALVAV